MNSKTAIYCLRRALGALEGNAIIDAKGYINGAIDALTSPADHEVAVEAVKIMQANNCGRLHTDGERRLCDDERLSQPEKAGECQCRLQARALLRRRLGGQ